MDLERRPYGADLTDAERTEIESHIMRVFDGVFVWEGIPQDSVFTIDLMCDRLETLAKGDPFTLAIDLEGSKLPGHDVRAQVAQRFGDMRNQLISAHIVVGRNIIMRTAARWVFRDLPITMRIHPTMGEAVESARAEIQDRSA